MYELIHNILLVVLIVFVFASLAIAAMIGCSRFRLHGLQIKDRKLNDRIIDRWFYVSVITFGIILFIAELGDILQLFLGKFGPDDSPIYAIILAYIFVFFVSVMYACILMLIEDLSSRIRFYSLERVLSSKIDEEVKREADEEAEKLERILQL
ncbi:hypothetical protein IKF67_00380 [Candidatus Saccharibacteria bacterium]|nr:hypothetical protein [Candidatus Saccharibacteria bacterium]